MPMYIEKVKALLSSHSPEKIKDALAKRSEIGFAQRENTRVNEVGVPKNYLQQEWPYKYGGTLMHRFDGGGTAERTSKLNDDPYVSEYFEYDVVPRYKREHPEVSDEQIGEMLNSYGSIPSSIGAVSGVASAATSGTDTRRIFDIPVGPKNMEITYAAEEDPLRATVVHENTHALRQGIIGDSILPVSAYNESRGLYPLWYTKKSSGYNGEEADRLLDAYDLSRFYFGDTGFILRDNPMNHKFREVVESGATNTELRFVLWRELYEQLGRRPTVDELDEYIKNYDNDTLMWHVDDENGYGQHSARYQTDADLVKDALIHVADNDTFLIDPNLAASGGKIHIKPENRGKFTALLKRTGKTASWYKAHGTPAQKKMAVFALNARKWKHGDGGFLQQYPDGGRIRGKRNGKFYVTELNDRREKKFQDWYANAAATLGLDPNPDAYEHAYDYRGYWLNNRDADVSSPDFHFPDTWKQPHHPTFSDESIYAKGHEGVGHWDGERFVPGPFNNIMRATEPSVAIAEEAPVTYGSNYTPSDDILQYIKDTEAFRDQWYQDGNGVWTVGYGFTGDDVRKRYPNGMTRAEADQYFADTVSRRIPMFVGATPNFDRLNQNQRDALFSYYYNIGHGGYTRKSPAMQEALKNFDLDTVVSNIDFGYNDKKNRGLRKRRDYERKLFGTPMDYGGILNRLRNVYGDNESVKAAILRAKNVKK